MFFHIKLLFNPQLQNSTFIVSTPLRVTVKHCFPHVQKVVKEIERHEGKVQGILSKHDQLRTSTSDDESSVKGAELSGDIVNLKEEATKKRDELKDALGLKQNLYDEATELHAMINDAQKKLEAEPVSSATVDGLKEQIAEHNVRVVVWWDMVVLVTS